MAARYRAPDAVPSPRSDERPWPFHDTQTRNDFDGHVTNSARAATIPTTRPPTRSRLPSGPRSTTRPRITIRWRPVTVPRRTVHAGRVGVKPLIGRPGRHAIARAPW